ncbi:MAG: glycosyltransferase family 1 protein [Candidatus Daviesbacteria bacterium]|nr:glycosyltransferase family 1 protein [Candidatus Daviesbacteria bacterium]
MKIAINYLPVKNAHKVRGIGYYTNLLLEFLKQDTSIQIQEFINLSEVKDANLVHYPWFDLFFHTLPIKRRLPTVVTIHDVMPLVFPEHYPVGLRGKINFILQEIALKSCNYIITDSKVSKIDIMKHLKIEDEKITVIPLASDPTFEILSNDTKLLHIKRQYRLPDQFLLYVGDANWVKNLPFLIEGFRQLIKSPGFKDIKLVLVGGVFLKDVENINHPELQSLKSVNQLIKQYKLEANIIRPGQLKDDDLVSFYNLATMYVQPSVYEGFGLPVLEAFACGTPVISSNRGSLPEVGGQAAVYFDPDDLKQFVSIMTELLENKSLLDKLSRLGLQQAAKFSWKKVAEQTKSVYLKALKND